MKNKLFKRIAIGTGGLFGLLVLVLCVHIYIVTRPKPIDPRAIVMARIDLHQDINKQDADKIVGYLDEQKGVSHVVVNLDNDNVVFTFFPIQTRANDIIKQFKSDLHYDNAVRYMPSADQMKGGCPMGYGGGSLLSQALNFFK